MTEALVREHFAKVMVHYLRGMCSYREFVSELADISEAFAHTICLDDGEFAFREAIALRDRMDTIVEQLDKKLGGV